MYKSLKKGWIPYAEALKKFRTPKSTMKSWRVKHPECFEVISGKIINVNENDLNKIVKRW